MLSLTCIAPGHQMFIPEIGGPVLKDLEVGVNSLLKLSLKIKTLDPDVLIVLTPGLPLYHHRFACTHAAHVIRVFESNQKNGEIVEIQFPGGDQVLTQLEPLFMEKKIPLEYMTHQAGAVAIDNLSLSLMYYLSKTGAQPEVIFMSMSDLSPEKHIQAGEVLAQFAEMTEKRVAIAAVGHVHTLREDVSSVMQENIQKGDVRSAVDSLSFDEYSTSGQNLFLPLKIIQGVQNTSSKQMNYHHFGTQFFEKEAYLCGYWE